MEWRSGVGANDAAWFQPKHKLKQKRKLNIVAYVKSVKEPTLSRVCTLLSLLGTKSSCPLTSSIERLCCGAGRDLGGAGNDNLRLGEGVVEG